MRRGDIWTAAGGKDYLGKPRPVVIIQDDSFDGTDSVTVCPFTSDANELPLLRVPIMPSERNGLRAICSVMIDKVTTVSKSKLGECVGRLRDEDLLRLNVGLLVFLGLAVSPRAARKASAPEV